MITKESGRCLDLIAGITLLKEGGSTADFWRGMYTRLILDADERGDMALVAAAKALLEETYDEMPLAKQPQPAEVTEAPLVPRLTPAGGLKTEVVNVRLTRELEHAAQDMAEADGMSLSALIRKLISDEVARRTAELESEGKGKARS